jgi:hypothetical protein
MNDQDHSLSLSDPDRSLVLSHLLRVVNFLKNLVSCQTSLSSKVAWFVRQKNVKTKPTTVIWLSSLFQKNIIEQGKKLLLCRYFH